MAGHDHTDHSHDDVAIPTDPVNAAGLTTVALGAAAVGLVAYAVMGFLNMGPAGEHGWRDLSMTYLCAWVFWACIPLGSLFLMLIGIVTSASWGVVLRRCFVAALRTSWLVPVLMLPVAASLFLAEGKQSPYWWSDHVWEGDVAAVAEATHVRKEGVVENQHKIHDLLNPVKFLAVTGVGFLVLGALTVVTLNGVKRNEDEGGPAAYSFVRRLAGPGVVVWVLTMTFLSTIWVVSVEPTWASSMFPIVFGMNCFLTTLTFSIFVFYTVNSDKADTLGLVKDKFRIDMGTLTLAITMVWAYASFSQYMLIWAGNLPEEVAYYRKRGDHGWEYLAYVPDGPALALPVRRPALPRGEDRHPQDARDVRVAVCRVPGRRDLVDSAVRAAGGIDPACADGPGGVRRPRRRLGLLLCPRTRHPPGPAGQRRGAVRRVLGPAPLAPADPAR